MANKHRTYRSSTPGVAAKKHTNSANQFDVITGVNAIHAVGLRNASGGTVYLFVFDYATDDREGEKPDLPVLEIPTGTTGWHDFGSYGAPMDNIYAVVSSSDTTLTTHASAFRITTIYS